MTTTTCNFFTICWWYHICTF